LGFAAVNADLVVPNVFLSGPRSGVKEDLKKRQKKTTNMKTNL
jgi:hypothetical protein